MTSEIFDEIERLTQEIIKKVAELQACYEVLNMTSSGDYTKWIIKQLDAFNFQLSTYLNMVYRRG